ncbi:hypothetical protein ACJIZ3_009984 [Penstemon smallii]|uniref:Uncharacterized protein n=1 Tax=Penstemon smallii TaxID=265156 RepID=A0ABD3TGD8_9LAMI
MLTDMVWALKKQIFGLRMSTFIKKRLKNMLVSCNRWILLPTQSLQELRSIIHSPKFRNILHKRLCKGRVVMFLHQFQKFHGFFKFPLS